MKEQNKKIKLSTLIYSIIVFILFLFFLVAGYVYVFANDNLIDKNLGEKIILPAIILNNKEIISIKEISENLKSIQRFYKNQDFSSLGYRIDFSTGDGKKKLKLREKELINKMIEDRAIEILANERKIKITKKMIDNAVERKISERGKNKKNIAANLDRLYGWSLSEFKNKVVKPSLYKEKLEAWVEENAGKEKKNMAKKKIAEAKKMLDSGMSFENVANKMNGGRLNGGYMGWFKKDFLAENIQDVVEKMQVGEISDVIETNLGYHILKLKDKKKSEKGEELYEISQIFFSKLTFADWLSDEIKKMNIRIFLKDYTWNSESGMVEFKDYNMKNFEEKVLKNPQRDISLMAL